MSENWLTTLITEDAQKGYELATTLANRFMSGDDYGQVVAIYFQTIAAANNYWRT